MSNGVYINSNKSCIYNQNTGEKYPMDVLVRETNIRNAACLIIM